MGTLSFTNFQHPLELRVLPQLQLNFLELFPSQIQLYLPEKIPPSIMTCINSSVTEVLVGLQPVSRLSCRNGNVLCLPSFVSEDDVPLYGVNRYVRTIHPRTKSAWSPALGYSQKGESENKRKGMPKQLTDLSLGIATQKCLGIN